MDRENCKACGRKCNYRRYCPYPKTYDQSVLGRGLRESLVGAEEWRCPCLRPGPEELTDSAKGKKAGTTEPWGPRLSSSACTWPQHGCDTDFHYALPLKAQSARS